MTLKMNVLGAALGLTAALLTTSTIAAVDPKLPDYSRTSGVSGNLTS